jgi:hypothetical protein
VANDPDDLQERIRRTAVALLPPPEAPQAMCAPRAPVAWTFTIVRNEAGEIAGMHAEPERT